MSENIEYDLEESTPLATALQKKAEQEAQKSGLYLNDLKEIGKRKFNEVKRRHAIEFLKKLENRLDELSNQSIANLLKALIALGLSIDDEEELEYWINLLTQKALNRFNEYFEQRDVKGFWKKINNYNAKNNITSFLNKYSEEDIAAFIDIINSLKNINMSKDKNPERQKKIDKFLGNIEKRLKNDLNYKKQNGYDRQRLNRNRREQPQRNDNEFEVLKEKMSSEGVESGGRYWNQVVSDFNASLDKSAFVRNWVVDVNAKNEEDIQKINELRGIDDKKQREQEELERQAREALEKTREQERNNERQRQQEKEQKDTNKNSGNDNKKEDKDKERQQNNKNKENAAKQKMNAAQMKAAQSNGR